MEKETVFFKTEEADLYRQRKLIYTAPDPWLLCLHANEDSKSSSWIGPKGTALIGQNGAALIHHDDIDGDVAMQFWLDEKASVL